MVSAEKWWIGGWNFSSSPTVNEEADQTSSPVTQVSKGDNFPTTAQASEGYSDTNSLLMPEMVNLEASGLRCSNSIASQVKTSYNFFSVISRFCAFGGLLEMSLTKPTVAFSHRCASVNAAIHQFNIINWNFDGSLNELHHMAFSVGKSNNENYTFCEMIKEDDASDFIKAMEKRDPRSWISRTLGGNKAQQDSKGYQDCSRHLVIQAQEFPRRDFEQAQSTSLCTWRGETMGSKLLGDLCSSGELD